MWSVTAPLRRLRAVVLVVVCVGCATSAVSTREATSDMAPWPSADGTQGSDDVDTASGSGSGEATEDATDDDGQPGASAPEASTTVTTTPASTSATAPPTSTTIATTTTTPLVRVRWEVPETAGGFAELAGLTGGSLGSDYLVTSTDDRGEGTYRDALAEGDRHIRFDPALDGAVIELDSAVLATGSNITLDGSGVDVTISGRATRFSGSNIVVAAMTFSRMDGSGNEDAVTFLEPSGRQIFGLYNNVFESATDGLVDVIWNRNHRVDGTICGNVFRHHDKAVLINSGGGRREGGRYHVTLCRNHWLDLYQRMPLARSARVHTYNSVFERYGKPAGDGGAVKAGEPDAEILLESNVVIPRSVGEQTWEGDVVNAPRAEYASPGLGGDGRVRVVDSLEIEVDGVEPFNIEQDPDRVFTPDYGYSAVPATEALRTVVVSTAGACRPAAEFQVVPCVPLVLAARGDDLHFTADGSIETPEVRLGDTVLEVRAAEEGRWAASLDGPVGEVRDLVVSVPGADVDQTTVMVGLVN